MAPVSTNTGVIFIMSPLESVSLPRPGTGLMYFLFIAAPSTTSWGGTAGVELRQWTQESNCLCLILHATTNSLCDLSRSSTFHQDSVSSSLCRGFMLPALEAELNKLTCAKLSTLVMWPLMGIHSEKCIIRQFCHCKHHNVYLQGPRWHSLLHT